MIEAGTEKVVGHVDFVAYLYSVITWDSCGNPGHRWWFNLNLMICQFYIPTCSIRLFQVLQEKRQVPGIFQKILAADVFLTQRFCNWAECFLPFRSLKLHYKVLEVSITYISLKWWQFHYAFLFSWNFYIVTETSVVILGRYKHVKCC